MLDVLTTYKTNIFRPYISNQVYSKRDKSYLSKGLLRPPYGLHQQWLVENCGTHVAEPLVKSLGVKRRRKGHIEREHKPRDHKPHLLNRKAFRDADGWT